MHPACQLKNCVPTVGKLANEFMDSCQLAADVATESFSNGEYCAFNHTVAEQFLACSTNPWHFAVRRTDANGDVRWGLSLPSWNQALRRGTDWTWNRRNCPSLSEHAQSSADAIDFVLMWA